MACAVEGSPTGILSAAQPSMLLMCHAIHLLMPLLSGNGYCKVWGTQPSSIDKAEDRDLWMALLSKLGIKQPSGATQGSPGLLCEPMALCKGIVRVRANGAV